MSLSLCFVVQSHVRNVTYLNHISCYWTCYYVIMHSTDNPHLCLFRSMNDIHHPLYVRAILWDTSWNQNILGIKCLDIDDDVSLPIILSSGFYLYFRVHEMCLMLWVPAALVMQGLVDFGRMGGSSLTAHSANIHQSKDTSLPQWTCHWCISPSNIQIPVNAFCAWNLKANYNVTPYGNNGTERVKLMNAIHYPCDMWYIRSHNYCWIKYWGQNIDNVSLAIIHFDWSHFSFKMMA